LRYDVYRFVDETEKCLVNTQRGIWNATVAQLKAGYVENETGYTCLCCGRQFEKGIVYPAEGRLYEAERYVRRHIETEHQSPFHFLIRQEKQVSGLSTVQRRLLELSYQGLSDVEIQKELGLGSLSTVRNHRFQLREKERQARVFLAIMELLREKMEQPAPAREPVRPCRQAAEQEQSKRDRVMAKFFPYGPDGPLTTLDMKAGNRQIVLEVVAQRFEPGRGYTEKEVNQILETVHPDFSALRRYMVDYGFLRRLPDGSRYWRPEETSVGEETNQMDRREMKRLAKETPVEAGVFQIKNLRNGKIFVEATRNLKTINGQRFQLEMGSHRNRALQRDWQEYGPDAFAFEVLEVLKPKEEEGPAFDVADALEKLKEKWLEKLQPYGDRGYNVKKEEA